ncbi:MAG: hypothetical protein EOO56_20255 [Hymenobacter sp.]|nr:MAG: hypothetical protein EOO56_20255 [Hymenobacter sp.]
MAWLYASYDADHSNSLLALLLGLGGLVSWLGLLVLGAYRIIKRHYLPWQRRLMPLWLVLIPLATATGYGFASALASARTWLLVESYDFTGSDNMLFKKDGEYQYWRGSPLGRSAVVRGHYERRDSLLLLKPTTDASVHPIAKIAIRPYLPFQRRENPLVRLVALDSTGTMQAVFRITERND